MSSENLTTRGRILEACWELLESRDGSAVRMSDIAKRAGISRQAVYLHFPSRAELLIATTRHIDEIKDVDARLVASRTAPTGVARLDAFIEAWGSYIPEIYGVAKALMAMQDSDEEAAAAWRDRMNAVRHGCAAAVQALKRDGMLSPAFDRERATDFLWTLLSVRNWEQLTIECGWSQHDYVETVKSTAHRILVGESANPTRRHGGGA